jgi:alanine-glyoxylate transaminase/serine-glyoxylate transaminase/serine-pyruvate transaminase
MWTPAQVSKPTYTSRINASISFERIGVLSNAKMIGEVVKRVSPDTLVVLDGVCSVASEEIRMDDWGIDVVLSATQKGLGTPPGLSVVCASQRALKVSQNALQNWLVSSGSFGIVQVLEMRKTPVSSYFANWKRWLPIMQAYEKGSPMYFATVSRPLSSAWHIHTNICLGIGSPP